MSAKVRSPAWKSWSPCRLLCALAPTGAHSPPTPTPTPQCRHHPLTWGDSLLWGWEGVTASWDTTSVGWLGWGAGGSGRDRSPCFLGARSTTGEEGGRVAPPAPVSHPVPRAPRDCLEETLRLEDRNHVSQKLDSEWSKACRDAHAGDAVVSSRSPRQRHPQELGHTAHKTASLGPRAVPALVPREPSLCPRSPEASPQGRGEGCWLVRGGRQQSRVLPPKHPKQQQGCKPEPPVAGSRRPQGHTRPSRSVTSVY